MIYQWTSLDLYSVVKKVRTSNTCLRYERGAKRESRLSTTPSPAGGGLYKDSCRTALFLLENIASTSQAYNLFSFTKCLTMGTFSFMHVKD
jgi:hypothetical protein